MLRRTTKGMTGRMTRAFYGTPAAGGAPPAFSPTDLTGLQLWLDASDSSTVLNSISPDTPATDGQAVRRWLDKSGNDLHANQATGVSQPLLDTDGLNSKGVLTFDGINDFFTSGTTSSFNFLHDGTESLVVIVVKPGINDNPGVSFTIIGNNGVLQGNVGVWVSYDDNPAVPRNNSLYAGCSRGTAGFAVLSPVNDIITPNVFSIAEIKFDTDNGVALDRAKFVVNNGPEQGSNTQTNAPSSSDASLPLAIGNHGNNASWFNGGVAEIIICNDPNTALRTDLRNYLATKWGITLA